MKTKTFSGLLAALFALCLSSPRAAESAEAVQTLPHGQLYELRELDLNKAQCRERVIARGSLEGVYEGEECGEGCSAVIRLDSGEKAYLGSDCDADGLYGPKGRRVVAHFEVRRFWYEYEEQGARGCSEMMVCVAPPAAASAPAAQAEELAFAEARRILRPENHAGRRARNLETRAARHRAEINPGNALTRRNPPFYPHQRRRP